MCVGYLNFLGGTEEAFRFDERVLGGKLTESYRFGAMPQQGGFELTPERKNLVIGQPRALRRPTPVERLLHDWRAC